MKKISYLSAVVGLLATFGVIGGSIGIIDTAEASSSRSHSSYSLAGRSFQIHGTYVSWDEAIGGPTPDDFENCYTFVDDDVNTWLDPLFPAPGFAVPGTWVQHTGGFVTNYTAFAEVTDGIAPGIDLSLIQNGTVTPTFRRGKQRLNAYSTVYFGPLPPESGLPRTVVLGVVLSRGYSVDSCD
jgi:hypothetical protein